MDYVLQKKIYRIKSKKKYLNYTDRTKKMIVMIEMIVLVYHLFSPYRSKRMIAILILKIQGAQIVNVSYHLFRHH